jgi:DNA-binding NarL/FixJ family response regulator
MVFASVVVLQPDARLAQELSSVLSPHFDSIHIARTLKEFREALLQRVPRVVVLDLESTPAQDVRALHRDFPGVPIVCTHRLPDDEMWTRMLEAGASDVCPTYDPASVLRSVMRSTEESSGAAA